MGTHKEGTKLIAIPLLYDWKRWEHKYLPTAMLLDPDTRMGNCVYHGPRTDRTCNWCQTMPKLIAIVQM